MSSISKLFSLTSNIKNWREYTFKKEERYTRNLVFYTKPFEIGFDMHAHNYTIFKEIFVEDFYEIKKVLSVIPNNPTVIDIGANVGFFSFLLLSKLPKSIIYAIEPFKSNCNILADCINKNNLSKNINIIEKAVSNKNNELLTLYYKSNNEESSIASIYSSFDERNTQSIQVPTTTLEEIVQNQSSSTIDILKMDCEGAEYSILLETNSSILKQIRLILLEVHLVDEIGYTPEALAAFLEANNFDITKKKFKNGCYYFFAKNKGFN